MNLLCTTIACCTLIVCTAMVCNAIESVAVVVVPKNIPKPLIYQENHNAYRSI